MFARIQKTSILFIYLWVQAISPAMANCQGLFERTSRLDEIKIEIRKEHLDRIKDRTWVIRALSLLKFRLSEGRLARKCAKHRNLTPELVQTVVKHEVDQVISILGKVKQHALISISVTIPILLAGFVAGIAPEDTHLVIGITIGSVVTTTIAPILTPMTAWIGRWHQRNRYIDMLKVDQYFEMVEVWRRTSAEYSMAELSTVYRVDQYILRSFPFMNASAEAFERGNHRKGVTMLATALYHIRVLSRDVPLNRFALNTINSIFEDVQEYPENLRKKLLERIKKFDEVDFEKESVRQLYEDNISLVLNSLFEHQISNTP